MIKSVFAYTLLFCLAFLNVPREFVHDCDHDHSDRHTHDLHDGVNFDEEGCFVCEFDLDVFDVPSFPSHFNIAPFEKAQNDRLTENPAKDLISLYALRGPPCG